MRIEDEPVLVEKILETAWKMRVKGDYSLKTEWGRPMVLGSLLHGSEHWESMVAGLTAARMGIRHVPLSWSAFSRSSQAGILQEFALLSSSVDLTLTTCIDHETFGGGRAITEALHDSEEGRFISLCDDIYSHQSALAELLAIQDDYEGFGGLDISVYWGFGNQFVLPNMVHSLCILGSSLGANITVHSPPEFSLLKRVTRQASSVASEAGAQFVESHEFSVGNEASDVVIAANWCRLDDFGDPEKNAEYAKRYDDWTFSPGNIPNGAIFLTPPPVQADLLASEELIQLAQNIQSSWLNRRVAVTAATIAEMVRAPEDVLAII